MTDQQGLPETSMAEDSTVEASTVEASTVEEAAVSAELMAEAEALKADYPDFDLEAELSHPVMGALLRGEGKPTLRQFYEAVHLEAITAAKAARAVEEAVAEAVEATVTQAVECAVRESEERLLGHIRARGRRPAENGLSAALGVRMHPAVGRLTRRERALLAKRAEDGETIRL